MNRLSLSAFFPRLAFPLCLLLALGCPKGGQVPVSGGEGSNGGGGGGGKTSGGGKPPAVRATPEPKPALPAKAEGVAWTGLEAFAEKGEPGPFAGKRAGVLLSAPLLDEPLNAASWLRGLEGVELAGVAAAPPARASAFLKPKGSGKGPALPESWGGKTLLELPTASEPFLSAEFWDGIDVLAIDLQLTGLRNDPALTILGVALEDAFEKEKKVVAFDRPNPLGGLEAGGPVQDQALYNQPASYYPLPIRHGMTSAEVAGFFNTVFGAGADLEIVELREWRRARRWPQAGLPWVELSPGLGSYEALLASMPARMAEAMGLEVSGEAGSPTFGAPGVDGRKLASEIEKALRSAPDGGALAASVKLSAGSRKPSGPSAKPWGGAKLEILDAKAFDPVAATFAFAAGGSRAGLAIDDSLAYPLIGSREVLDALKAGGSVSSAVRSYDASLQAFQLERLRAQIYKR